MLRERKSEMLSRSEMGLDQRGPVGHAHRYRSLRLLWLAAGLACAILAIALAPPAGAIEGTSWEEVSHPRPSGQQTTLRDVTAPAEGDAWAVGYRRIEIGGTVEFRTYVLRWNGSVWSISPARDREGAPATNLLSGVDATSSDDVWTVGFSRDPSGPAETLIEHWDGSSWRIVSSPNPAPYGGNYLAAVAGIAPGNAWAVGTQYDPSVQAEAPLVLRWDGRTWTTVEFPIVPGCKKEAALTDVAGSAGNILAVGHCEVVASNARQGFVARWNGSRWRVVAGQGTVPEQSRLNSIAVVGPGEFWAVGETGAPGSQQQTLALHGTGNTWTRVSTPSPGYYPSLLGVAALGPKDVWAVGLTGSTFARRLSLHWDGKAWTRAATPGYSRLEGVAIDPAGTTWAVGSRFDESLILRRVP